MKNISKYTFGLLLLILPATAPFNIGAQGYYYPPPPGYYYPQYQQQQSPPYQRQQQPRYQQDPPQQQRRQTPEESSQPRPKAKVQKDKSGDMPPASDMTATSGPLISYTWDFNDTLADLAKAAGITPNQILNLNNIALSQLRDGQVLKVPNFSPADTAGLDIKHKVEPQMAREVWRGIRGKKRVALTYDAGGDPDGLDTLLKNLHDLKTPATFFATGKFAEDHPDLVQKISAAGMPIHNHSWSHPEFTSLSNAAVANELSRTDDILSSITGRSTKPFWRPPFGDRDDRVLQTAARNGYRSIYWTIDTLDSVNDAKDANFVANRVLSPPKAKANPDHFLDGAIILMHVGKTGTAEAVPQIVNGLRERGFTLVTVEEILQP